VARRDINTGEKVCRLEKTGAGPISEKKDTRGWDHPSPGETPFWKGEKATKRSLDTQKSWTRPHGQGRTSGGGESLLGGKKNVLPGKKRSRAEKSRTPISGVHDRRKGKREEEQRNPPEKHC